MDTKRRSWVKSIVWRLIGIFLLGLIAYSITGNWLSVTIISVLFHGLRIIFYYFHERLWERVSWGKVKHPLAELPVKGKLAPDALEIIKEKLMELGYIEKPARLSDIKDIKEVSKIEG